MQKHHIQIPVGKISLGGELLIPEGAGTIIVFSHGSGSSRFSPRNMFVAEYLRQQGFATLLFDLLTEREDADAEKRFDIALLTQRLVDVTEWLFVNETTRKMKIAYFGASTGAASALQAAAEFGEHIAAVVSRGGRPDLALNALPDVKSPVLLMVGEYDDQVIQLNKMALEQLRGEKKMVIVPGATHLFEEPGKLEVVAKMAGEWYKQYCSKEDVASPI